ncbi:MAG: hypothetical protein ABIF01_05370 [Candidatus Micrarchaeota archaeon]
MLDKKKLLVAAGVLLVVAAVFLFSKSFSKEQLTELGLSIPLPLFTFLIAIIDGFNPCTMWVLTFLLVLLMSVSNDRKRILAVGAVFVAVVYVFYFTFMAAWLNIFRYIGYIDPLRIGIAILAIVAGAINCKEFFAFRKGVTLMIQEGHKDALTRKVEGMKDVIKRGSMPALIGASAFLAAFSSLVELPCTAGWPIIFTKILSEKTFEKGFEYYSYLLLYNLVYVLPLSGIILAFTYFFTGKQISRGQMEAIKLLGGLIMLALGIILLVNPGLLMLA